ncbi:RNA polymerase subunit sigma-70 [Luteimonas sp. XNQY3]|nr:RNA polymerase subunit sigma-70 [Luteimonas sp. XNQY3]
MHGASGVEPITQLLQRWQQGDRAAADLVAGQVYRELRDIAVRRLRGEGQADLQPTELLHEAWIRLSLRSHPFASRAHFYAAAALQMRHLLIDMARMRASQKREGVSVTLTLRLVDPSPHPEDMQLIAQAFDRLSEVDPRKAQAFALNELAGFSVAECAAMLEVSVATLERDLRFARSWVASRLRG